MEKATRGKSYLGRTVVWSLLLTGLVFSLHFLPFTNSMLNFIHPEFPQDATALSEEYLADVVQYHHEDPAFARRVVTNGLIDGLTYWTGLGQAHSFIWVNAVLLFFCGPALFLLAKRLVNERSAFISVVAFYSGFTILLAFYPPLYTYDEPAQYLLIFFALALWVSGRAWLSLPFWLLALMTRESTVFLFPGLVFLSIPHDRIKTDLLAHGKVWRSSLPLWGALVLYVVTLYIVVQSQGLSDASVRELSNRLSGLEANFGSLRSIWDTLWSILLTLALPLYLIFRSSPEAYPLKWRKAFVLTFVINTTVILLSTNARECRLLVLPLVFSWPFFGSMILEEWQRIKEGWRRNQGLKWMRPAVILMPVALYALLNLVYRAPIGPLRETLFDEYGALMMAAIISSWMITRRWSSAE